MSPFIAEIVGTFLLILLGNGVVATCVLKNTKASGSGWMVITTAWAFAVFIGVVVAGPYSGAHMNPAVTIGLAVAGKFPWASVPMYLAGEFIGAMLGALCVYIYFIDHFKVTEEEGLKRACFCTEPAIRNLPVNYMNEVIGTFVLVFVIFYLAGANITLPGADASTPIGLGSIGALPVAILVWVIGLCLGSTTGYAINPARDGGPRIVLTLLQGKVGAKPDWAYGIVPLTAPIVGGVIAAVLYTMLS